MPVWPSVADFLSPLPPAEDEADGEPRYMSDFFLTPGVASLVPVDSLEHLLQTIITDDR